MKALFKYTYLPFLFLVTLSGCQVLGLGIGNKKPPTAKPDTLNRTLATYASPGSSSRNPLIVHGFGLVYNLGDNGGVEVDSAHRRLVVEELKRMDIKTPSQLVDSKNTAIVHVQAEIPPGTRKGEPIDVQITLPPGSECRSLQGGILYKTVLTEMMDFRGSYKRGDILATVEGPLLLDPKIDKNSTQFEKCAVILGKAECRIDRDFNFALKTDGRETGQLARIADELERCINKRFKIEGEPTGVAKAKAQPAVSIEVKMHPLYREDPGRYLAVLMSIRCFENETQQTQRFEDLKRELLDPDKT
ncbi:MAG: flagellar basal body P-ring protein FlgI, partial [Clostridia bacterium]|nr:flagellar basal body P-ring protein FlgI [Clostridia bacterium]